MPKLNIGFWNTHGLSNQQINDVDFINYVNKFDIVGFVETLASENTTEDGREYSICNYIINLYIYSIYIVLF
jgi:hypothetical protein